MKEDTTNALESIIKDGGKFKMNLTAWRGKPGVQIEILDFEDVTKLSEEGTQQLIDALRKLLDHSKEGAVYAAHAAQPDPDEDRPRVRVVHSAPLLAAEADDLSPEKVLETLANS